MGALIFNSITLIWDVSFMWIRSVKTTKTPRRKEMQKNSKTKRFVRFFFIKVATAALVILSAFSKAGAEPIAKPAKVAELARQVEIRRTAYGVPHIKGETEAAAAFGFGYCQAEDHVLSIMRLILRARGELAKNFGGRENLESDFWNRQFRVHARAEETYDKLDPNFREVIEGFAVGFDYYIQLHRDKLPAWVQPVTPHDVAAHGLAGVMRFAFDRGGIIGSFLRKQGKKTAWEMDQSDGQQEMIGSNMWGFAPSRTASGKTILMGNPHQPWAEVSTYYEAHITVPGKLNFYGSTYVGRPILTTGFNDNLGWSHTVNYADLEEIYEFDLDPAHPDHYLFDGGSVPIKRDDVTVEIKDGDKSKSEARTFWHTPLGPVILRTDDKIYVFRSACYDQFRSYEQWYRMSKCKNFADFREALDMLEIPMFNLCYADVEGNIYYLWNGTVPVLPHEAHTDTAVHASRSPEIWTRFHPVAELPQLFNPKGGYVQNCNDPPYLTNLQAPLDPAKYPAYFGVNKLGLRTQHSLTLLDNDKKFSLEDVSDMKFSPRMLLAERMKKDLIEAVNASQPNDETRQALAMLEKWDNTVRAESRGSVLFADWWLRYSELRGTAIRPDSYAIPWSADQPISTPRGLGDKKRAVETFLRAMEETKKEFGGWDVSWGDVHRVRKGNVDVPVSGGSGFMGCFRVLEFGKEPDGKLKVTGGDGWIFTAEFTQPPRAYSVLGYSESEDEKSPYYNDQCALYADNKMKKVAFTESEIKEQLLRSYHPGE